MTEFKPFISAGLADLGAVSPTPIQAKAIPLLLSGRSVLASAPTGTGKTLAFLLPILQRTDLDDKRVQAVIVSPTRELAAQICAVARVFSKREPRLSVSLLAGGSEARDQGKKLRDNPPHLAVATPGRLLSLLRAGAGKGFLAGLRFLAYDEADMFVDATFFDEYYALRQRLTKRARITEAVFGATLHQALRDRFRKLIPGAQTVTAGAPPRQGPALRHYAVFGAGGDRFAQLLALTRRISPYLCLVFAPNQGEADSLAARLTDAGVPCAKLHGGLDAAARRRAFAAIRSRAYAYAVVTDLAARGIDVAGASHAVSWGLPRDASWYAHRAGRAGRAGHEGASYVLLDLDDERAAGAKLPKHVAWRFVRVSPDGSVKPAPAPGRPKRPPARSAAASAALRQIALAAKKVKPQPNSRKRLRLAAKKILQREKRAAIDAKVKAVLRKRAKNAQKP